MNKRRAVEIANGGCVVAQTTDHEFFHSPHKRIDYYQLVTFATYVHIQSIDTFSRFKWLRTHLDSCRHWLSYSLVFRPTRAAAQGTGQGKKGAVIKGPKESTNTVTAIIREVSEGQPCGLKRYIGMSFNNDLRISTLTHLIP